LEEIRGAPRDYCSGKMGKWGVEEIEAIKTTRGGERESQQHNGRKEKI